MTEVNVMAGGLKNKAGYREGMILNMTYPRSLGHPDYSLWYQLAVEENIGLRELRVRDREIECLKNDLAAQREERANVLAQKDQFAIAFAGKVVGSLRLNSTARPHQLETDAAPTD
jgi:hypothetical protein